MIKKLKNLAVLFFTSLFLFTSLEASWITKKSDESKEIKKEIKKEKKQKSKWIKLKKKENKQEYKKEDKKITKEVKSWITKKLKKNKHIASINDLPNDAIYFTGSNETKEILFYGYVVPDKTSDLIDGYHKTSKGFGYFNDGKTTCRIGSTVLFVEPEELTARVSGNCTNGINFRGKTSQTQNAGWGQAKTHDGEILNFNFNNNKNKIAKIFDNNVKSAKNSERFFERQIAPKDNKKIVLKPNGKYYALLIGNSLYDAKGWDQLVSPVNDITEIKKILDKSYKFEKIFMIKNGTKKEIFNGFKELAKLTTTNDYVFIYYSGHGETRAEQAYWIPKDGSSEWGNGDWININELNIFLTEIKAHHLAVMVDSCYVGGKFKGTNILDVKKDDGRKIWTDNLNDDLNLRARSVLSSGSTGRVSDTVGNTNHSMFALSLLNILKLADKEEVPINLVSVAMNIRSAFSGNFNQKPYYYHPDTWKHGGGDFIFIPKKNLR